MKRVLFSRTILLGMLLIPLLHLSGRAQGDSLSWTTVGEGVSYAAAGDATGEQVFIGFGGWTVRDAWAQTWVRELYAARLRTLGVRHLYVVRGPVDTDYYGRDIETQALAQSLVGLLESSQGITRVIIAAHSSGAYVAHALFEDLYTVAALDSGHVTDGKIVYFNLDGGIGAGSGVEITGQMAEHLVHIYGVYALIPASNLYSPNRSEMEDLGGMFGARSSSILVDASGCGCTGTWCVHETVINQKPYNATTFDLKNDYGSINAEHPVATAYLDVLTDVPGGEGGGGSFRLEQNFPNPFNPATSITYSLAHAADVRLTVHDILGREIALLVDRELPPGTHTTAFDASDLPSGVYLCRLAAGGFAASRRMLMLR
jgi:hypothetical protein